MPAGTSFGATLEEDGVRFRVWSEAAERVWLSLFRLTGIVEDEVERLELVRQDDNVHALFVPGLGEGTRYGLRADGPYEPGKGLWFDPRKLLIDPYALEISHPCRYNALLAAPRWQAVDTAPMLPKAIVTAPPVAPLAPPLFAPGGLIYEINVRAFTRLHPDVPEPLRGTIAALAHPAIIDHLRALHVAAVELMPITAWMDERHLPPLGLRNAWGYNPVGFMALDPRLAPGGWRELRETVASLHAAGIGVILDMVFNHTAESDDEGPTVSLRGLDARAYYRHDEAGRLVNDTGTGNTLACDHPAVIRLVLDSLRAFIRHAAVDGFRFDLAPILGRTADGFSPDAPLLAALLSDPEIASRILIAEPWDIGPGGYQLGRFPGAFLEWNDRYRDDMRRFWRGDAGMVGALATRLAGSSDIFAGTETRAINFIAAHDGMTLADLVAYETRHNHANGEDNRDGHGENFSLNHGVEGPTTDPAIAAARPASLMALLATLFVSRGTIMLTAGDEFGRSQQGNNNAYAQDNETTWLDWDGRDHALQHFVERLAALRRELPALHETAFLAAADVEWLRDDGAAMGVSDWNDPARKTLIMVHRRDNEPAVAVAINGAASPVAWPLQGWRLLAASSEPGEGNGSGLALAQRSVAIFQEKRS